MEWPMFAHWIAEQAQRGGDVVVHLDLAPQGASSPVLLTLRLPVTFDTTDPDLVSWTAGEHSGGITRPDYVRADVSGEAPNSVTAHLRNDVLVTFSWSEWPDRRHR